MSGNAIDADAGINGRIMIWEYHGQDNQLWLWDDDSIRSKKIPNKVLQVERARSDSGYANANLRKLVLGIYGQRWTSPRDQDIIEGVRNPLNKDYHPTLCTENFNTANDTKVIACPLQGQCNDKWTLSVSRVYFLIINRRSGEVISPNTASSFQMEYYEMSKKQLYLHPRTKVLKISSNN